MIGIPFTATLRCVLHSQDTEHVPHTPANSQPGCHTEGGGRRGRALHSLRVGSTGVVTVSVGPSFHPRRVPLPGGAPVCGSAHRLLFGSFPVWGDDEEGQYRHSPAGLWVNRHLFLFLGGKSWEGGAGLFRESMFPFVRSCQRSPACCTSASACGRASGLRRPPSQRACPPGGQAVCALLGAELSAEERRPRSQRSPPASLCFPRRSHLDKGREALASAPPQAGSGEDALQPQQAHRGGLRAAFPDSQASAFSPGDLWHGRERLRPDARLRPRLQPPPLCSPRGFCLSSCWVGGSFVFCLQRHRGAIERGPQWELCNGTEGCYRSGRHLGEPSGATEIL